MKRYNVELGLICEPDDESGFARLMTEIDEPVCLASDVADLERRLSEAVELIAKLRAGVERYSSDLCREADDFLAEEER